MAKRTGFAVEALSELKFVASQTGTSLEALEAGFRRRQRSIYDAGRGLSTQTDALADLSLTHADLRGLAPEQQFERLADAIARPERFRNRNMLEVARGGVQNIPSPRHSRQAGSSAGHGHGDMLGRSAGSRREGTMSNVWARRHRARRR